MSPATRRPSIVIGGARVGAGELRRVDIPVARLPTQTHVSLPVAVVHGRREGPVIWLSAAVHGDEINGVEIIRQVLTRLDPRKLRGTVLAVPIVNVFGFINESRYLPDRRDLNRSFPGSERGSLASRLAHLFMEEIVRHCTHGIDLHTASTHRSNLPQVRASLDDPETRACAEAFCAPVMLDSSQRDGSLRGSATRLGIPVLLYEGGEPHRFNKGPIETGVEGVVRVMARLNMGVPAPRKRRPASLYSPRSAWVRARRAGLFRRRVELGDRVEAQQRLGVIADAFGQGSVEVRAARAGLVIGLALDPLVNQGDALVHVADIQDA